MKCFQECKKVLFKVGSQEDDEKRLKEGTVKDHEVGLKRWKEKDFLTQIC